MIGTAADLATFAAKRGEQIDSAQGEIYLVKANDFLANNCWLGEPVDPAQDDIFPRMINGKQVEAPPSIIKAVYMLAMQVADGVDLMPVVAGKQTIEERIEGAITVKYTADSIGSAPSFPWLDKLLSGWVDPNCDLGVGLTFKITRG